MKGKNIGDDLINIKFIEIPSLIFFFFLNPHSAHFVTVLVGEEKKKIKGMKR